MCAGSDMYVALGVKPDGEEEGRTKVKSQRILEKALRPHSWRKSRQKYYQRVFLLAIQSHLYSFALRFLLLQTHSTSYNLYIVLVYTVKEKGGKPDRKLHPLPNGLKIHTETSSLRTLKIMTRNLKEIVRS